MKVDMSPRAVKGRLELVSQLWRLSVSLGKAKRETVAQRKNENISGVSENAMLEFEKRLPSGKEK
jgi:hypothetical protein